MAARRHRIRAVAVMSALLSGLVIAGPTGATTSEDSVAENSVSASLDTGGDSSVAPSAEIAVVEILSPDEPWAGVSLGEWGARWWQWTTSMPEDMHPGSDTTGERCGYGQHGPMFFLPIEVGPGPSYSYECVVPEGTAIYVYVSVGNCSSVEPSPFFGANEDQLQACVESDVFNQSPPVETSVNGLEVANLDSYRTTTPMFTLNVPEDSVLDFFPPGVALAMATPWFHHCAAAARRIRNPGNVDRRQHSA